MGLAEWTQQMRVEDLVPRALTAFDTFHADYRALVARTDAGGDGSTVSNGTHSQHLRSETRKVVQLLVWATESLNGSGELPDADALRSHAANTGVEPDGFISMLWSLMGMVDVIFSIKNGDGAMVGRVFDGMKAAGVQRSTWANIPSRKPTTQERIISPATVQGSSLGTTYRPVPSSKTTARKRKKAKPGRMPTKKATSSAQGGKRSAGKRGKSGRK